MKTLKFLLSYALLIISCSFLGSCFKEEDPGPLQAEERDYAILDFDRIDVGDAFVITVQQSPVYAVHVRGDRRNLDDLSIAKIGSTLTAGYKDSRHHAHTTFIIITMPVLAGAALSGASYSTISGFEDADGLELILSGASIAQFNGQAKRPTFNLSGASKLTVSGKADLLVGKASGASELHTYALDATDAYVEASGASKINVFASQSLNANASGASMIYYRGNPSVISKVSGASFVKAD